MSFRIRVDITEYYLFQYQDYLLETRKPNFLVSQGQSKAVCGFVDRRGACCQITLILGAAVRFFLAGKFFSLTSIPILSYW